jgi:IS1 family transposase
MISLDRLTKKILKKIQISFMDEDYWKIYRSKIKELGDMHRRGMEEYAKNPVIYD